MRFGGGRELNLADFSIFYLIDWVLVFSGGIEGLIELDKGEEGRDGEAPEEKKKGDEARMRRTTMKV